MRSGQVRSGNSTNLRSVVRVATGVGTRRHVLAVGGVDVGDEAVLGHHPVELLQAAARVGVLQVEQEGGPVPVSPGELSLRNIDYIHPEPREEREMPLLLTMSVEPASPGLWQVEGRRCPSQRSHRDPRRWRPEDRPRL